MLEDSSTILYAVLRDYSDHLLTPLTPLKLGCHPQHDIEVMVLNVYAFLENK